MRTRSIATAAGAVGLLLASACSVPASAGTTIHRASTTDPLASCNAVNDVARTRGYEHQASLEVDPSDGAHLAAVWTQELDDGTVLASSRDGGSTWSAVAVPGQVPGCGDQEDVAMDTAQNPRAAVGPDGAVYVVSNISSSKTAAQAVRINVTRDDGRTWEGSFTLERGASLDWVWVAADPLTPGTAHVLWGHRETDGIASVTGAWEHVATTTDWGAHWATQGDSVRLVPPQGRTYQWGQLYALADHSLLDVFAECDPSTQCDDGSAPIRTSRFVGGAWTAPVRGPDVGGWFDTAVTTSGELLITSVIDDAIRVWRSDDLGVTWRKDAAIAVSGGAYRDATIATTASGTAVIAFYEQRGADAMVRLATSNDRTRWSATDVAGPFDDDGPALGKGMGEWLGLSASGPTAELLYVTGASRAPDPGQAVVNGPTDVFVASVDAQLRARRP
jgi:hypothetical protein